MLFGCVSIYKDFNLNLKAKAQTTNNYTFKTDGSYKWAVEGGNLTNYVDVYDKTTNQKITTLKIYYANKGNGTLSNYSVTSAPGVGGGISITKIGEYTRHSVASTSDSKFAILPQYVGNYHILTEPYKGPVYPDPVQIYSNVFYTIIPAGSFTGYSFAATTDTMLLQTAEPKTDDWYGVYLNDTIVSIKNGGQPVTPITPSTSPGSGTTTGQEGGCAGEIPECATPKQFQPWLGIGTGDVDQSLSESLKQSNITTAWGLTLDLINVIAIFVLLAIAFANILHLGERDEYNFKRLIPALVIGLILANFSHLLCRAIIDFAAMLMNFFIPKNETMNVSYNLVVGMWGGFIQQPLVGAAVAFGTGIVTVVGFMLGGLGCAVIVVAAILLLLPVIIIGILFLLLAVRVYVIWFLVIISPIAFFLIMFSAFQKQIQWWWTWFFQWVFMGPIVYFMIYIAEGFTRGNMFPAPTGGLQCFDLSAGSQVDGLTKYLFVNALLVLAIIIPYMMGKQVFVPLWKYFGSYAAKATGVGISAGGTLATKGVGKLTKGTLGRIPGRTGKFFGAIGGGMEKAIAPHLLIPAAQQYFKERGEAQVGAAQKQIQKSVESLPGGRNFNRDMNKEWGIKNGSNFAQGSGWGCGALSADQDRIVSANLNGAAIKRGTNASREDLNIQGFRMQRLRRLTGLDGRTDASGEVVKGHELLKYDDVYGPGKDLIDVEQAIHKKSGGRVNAKRFKGVRERVDEEVSAAHEARGAKGSATTYMAEDVMNGTAVTLDGDLREGNLGYMASRRTTERQHGTAGPMNP